MIKSAKVPVLNRFLAVLVALITIAFFFVGLVAGLNAALGGKFFYSSTIVKLFPYQDSIFDFFRGMVRIIAGIVPALIVMAISHVIISYLTEGKKRAVDDLAGMLKGFFYQLTHPFSNPRDPMGSKDENNYKK